MVEDYFYNQGIINISMNIKHSIALVTGANRGVGLALVEELLARSVDRVYAAVRSPELLEKVILRHGDRVIPIRFDIVNEESVAKATDIANDITLLVNNAGVSTSGSLLDSPIDMIRHDMETNFFGTLNVARYFAPILEKNGGGAIVNILSISALASSPDIGGYSASKAATYSLTQGIRAQLVSKGIRVHGVFMGPIDTDMTRDLNIRKANPIDVVREILNGLEENEEDIFPDGMSKQASVSWRSDPKIFERQLASIGVLSIENSRKVSSVGKTIFIQD